jgi:enoyl-CoA hydratase
VIHTRFIDDGRVVVVTIDRPERRNALDHDALDGLAAALGEATSAGVRALVLTGADGHFCAGADLTGVEDPAFVVRLNEVLEGLRSAPFPTLAAADGAALGAGTQLAVACDLRVATPGATFGIPAARLGLMVDGWTVQRLVSMAGQGTARAMLLAAETVSGTDAHRLGLVQRLGGLDEALDWATAIAALAPLTIAGHKVGCNEAESLDATSDTYRAAWTEAWSSADLAEGLAAFAERRPARFEGR